MNINDIINNVYRLPQTSLDTLVASISKVEYPKNFHLHRENKKETKSYFIKKGIVRAYTHKDNKEVTFWFGQEGDLILPLQTLFWECVYRRTPLFLLFKKDAAFYKKTPFA